MAKLRVTIEEIKEVSEHPNADRLELVKILGWTTVVPKGQYNVGDRVVYIPVDAQVPQAVSDKLGVTQYLGKNGRVRAARLRGVTSYGLVFSFGSTPWCEGEAEIGRDVASLYEIEKYEPPQKLFSGDMEKEHPLFHRYTKIENYQNFPDILVDQEEVVALEKIHGCLDFDTLIETDQGEMKIGELVENETRCNVLTFDVESGEQEWSPIIEFSLHQESVPWYEIELEDGTILKVTENHYIWLPENDCYRKVGDLKEDDVLLVK